MHNKPPITSIFLLAAGLLNVSGLDAQENDCPAIVQAALAATDQACEAAGRNQACYGNIQLEAMPHEGVAVFTFEKSGDLVNVASIQSLRLSSMSVTDESWGVALMKLQANLPDTLPGQNVTFLLFGDVQIDNAVIDAPEIPMTAAGDANVRLRPTTSANNVMASVTHGQEVIATGRLPDSSWVQIKTPQDARGVGWVSAQFIDGDVERLAVIEPDAPKLGPMQAFYFQTGVGDRPCAEAPDSGILVQTPKGAGRVTFNANEVEVTLGSTVYLQAQPGSAMTVTVLEGAATLTAGGVTQTVPAGAFSRAPMNASGQASGAPEAPRPYDRRPLLTLPVRWLPEPIDIPLPLSADQIDAAVQALQSPLTPTPNPDQQATSATNGSAAQNSSLPGRGQWVQDEVVTFNTCPGPLSVGDTNIWYPILTFSDDRQTFTYDGGPNSSVVTLARAGDNVYQGVFGDITLTFTFTSPTAYKFSWVGVHGDPNSGGCRFEMQADATLVSGSPR